MILFMREKRKKKRMEDLSNKAGEEVPTVDRD